MIPYLDSIGFTVGAAAIWTCAVVAATSPLNSEAQRDLYAGMQNFKGVTAPAQVADIGPGPATVTVAREGEIPTLAAITVRPEPQDLAAARARLAKAEQQADELSLKLKATEAALAALANRAAQTGDPALSRALEQVRKGLS